MLNYRHKRKHPNGSILKGKSNSFQKDPLVSLLKFHPIQRERIQNQTLWNHGSWQKSKKQCQGIKQNILHRIIPNQFRSKCSNRSSDRSNRSPQQIDFPKRKTILPETNRFSGQIPAACKDRHPDIPERNTGEESNVQESRFWIINSQYKGI